MLHSTASSTFEDSYKALSRIEHKENYDALKKQHISDIMSFIQTTNKGFTGYLKDVYTRIYIGQQLDKHAQAINDPKKRKEINSGEKEKAMDANRETLDLAKTVAGRKGNEKLMKLRKDITYRARKRLDKLKGVAYDDHERTVM